MFRPRETGLVFRVSQAVVDFIHIKSESELKAINENSKSQSLTPFVKGEERSSGFLFCCLFFRDRVSLVALAGLDSPGFP